MKVLVAGSTGVLGRHTVDHLLRRGHEVWALTRSSERSQSVKALGARTVQGDVLDLDRLTEVVAQGRPDAVVNLATKIPTSDARHSSAWDGNDRVRSDGTRNLLNAARSARVQSFVLASVGRVYEGGQQWVAEGDLIYPHRVVRSALDMERQAIIAAEQEELHTLILRAGNVYSADDYQTLRLVSHLRRGRLPIPGRGGNYWSLVHADDAGQAFALAVEAAGSGSIDSGAIINVGDNEPMQTGRLFRHLARMLGARQPIPLPNMVIRLVVGRYPAWALAQSVRMRNTRARELLGFKPRFGTCREGYARVISQMDIG